MSNTPLDDVRDYYTNKVKQFGRTPAGADWKDRDSQERRFEQLARIVAGEPSSSIADIGCGYGALLPYLRGGGWNGHYEGVDISPEMIQEARVHAGGDKDAIFTAGTQPTQKPDFVVSSGIFNVKLGADNESWEEFVFETLESMVANASRGVAFNCLTGWSDVPRMRSDLYYASPERMLAHCASRFTRWIELSHDYGLFEFTIRMRFDGPFPRLRELD